VRRQYLIIDGYNLLHAAGLARKKYGPGQLERCRAQLVLYLAQHLTESERERATIVFDSALAPPGLPRELTARGITVRFAAPGKDADGTIEELIAGHSAPRQIRVISSDHRLQRSIQKRRGDFSDSEDFVQELERRGPIPAPQESQAESSASPPKRERDTDTEHWLAVFGEMPEAKDLFIEVGRKNQVTQDDVARIEKEIAQQDAQERPRGRRRRE
jgi:predicted RNA-binding protein with PIN domain